MPPIFVLANKPGTADHAELSEKQASISDRNDDEFESPITQAKGIFSEKIGVSRQTMAETDEMLISGKQLRRY